MIAIIVENCAGCCFSSYEQAMDAYWCSQNQTYIDGPTEASAPPPDWCPLRENDRLVTLRVK